MAQTEESLEPADKIVEKPITKKLGSTLLIRIREDDRRLFEEASRADGYVHVSKWIRVILGKAVERALKRST
jgi:hypothetical protein